MRASRIAGIAISALVIGTPSAFGQTPPPTQPQQPPTQQQQPSQQTKSSDTAATQTFVGCLMSEPDYRRAHNLGNGVAGMGLGDEFVLVDVKVSDAKGSTGTSSSDMYGKGSSASTGSKSSTGSASSASSTSSASSASSSSKCVDRGTAYRLTGTNEEKIKGLVGKQLEIQGRLKHADDATAGAASSTSSSASSTSGNKEKLPAEVEIVSFREAPGRDAVNEPAASTMPASSTSEPAAKTQATEPAAKAQTTPRTPPPSSTMDPARPQTDTQPANPKPDKAKSELPRTASSTPLLALIGVLALCSGFILTVIRRRRVL